MIDFFVHGKLLRVFTCWKQKCVQIKCFEVHSPPHNLWFYITFRSLFEMRINRDPHRLVKYQTWCKLVNFVFACTKIFIASKNRF